MEVAVKIAFRKYMTDHKVPYNKDKSNKALYVLAQNDCYHGDTLGVMNIADGNIFNEQQHP
jgi:dethiobiotin synthetase/adenosylmethionine--8-amino-7-oxononanoate aminotransferase